MQEKLDKAKYLNRVIIASWIGLALCFVIKIFGGNLFEVACANENFIAVCDYAEENQWAYYLIGAVYCFISLYFYMLAILQQIKYKKWQFILIIITVIIGSFIKMHSVAIGWIFDIWQSFVLPIVLLNKRYKEYWKIVVAIVLLLLFQIASMYTKNINLGTLGDNVLIGCIFSIDVLLMVIIYYAYSNCKKIKKEK